MGARQFIRGIIGALIFGGLFLWVAISKNKFGPQEDGLHQFLYVLVILGACAAGFICGAMKISKSRSG